MRVEFIADPVHGHVPVTVASTTSEVAEDSLLRSPWLRRLQRIHQMTTAYLVFPGATHTRFAHALGTCHLAGALAARAYERYAATFGRRDLPERDRLVETYRLAVPQRDLYSFAVRPTTADAFERTLRAALPPGLEVRVDVPYGEQRSVNPLSEDERRASVPVFDPETGVTEPLGIAALLREIPLRFCALRVFARPERRAEVAAIARDVAASLDLRAAGASPA